MGKNNNKQPASFWTKISHTSYYYDPKSFTCWRAEALSGNLCKDIFAFLSTSDTWDGVGKVEIVPLQWGTSGTFILHNQDTEIHFII